MIDKKTEFSEFTSHAEKAVRLIDELRLSNNIPLPIMMGAAGKYIVAVSLLFGLSAADFRTILENLAKDYEKNMKSKK